MRGLAVLLAAVLHAAGAAPVITLPGFGRLSGTVHNTSVLGPDGAPVRVASFRGIPFAVFRRWEGAREARSVRSGRPHLEPTPPSEVEDVDARSFGPGCVIASGAGLVPPEGDEQEDCLTINVWCVSSADDSGCADGGSAARPVAFFLHGGAFILGSAKHPYAAPDPDAFVASTGAVYVKPQYRLGALGFLAHPAMPLRSAGTFGLGDQRTALRWVSRHAAAFGGDAARVMASGSSAGAMSMCFHMVDDRTKGLFRAVMLQSPQCSYPFPDLQESHLRARRLAQAVGCERGGAGAEELRSALLAAGHNAGTPLDATTADRAAAIARARREARASAGRPPSVTPTPPDAGRAHAAVTPLPAAAPAGVTPLSSSWWEGVFPSTPYDPATRGLTPSLEGRVSLWIRGNRGVFPAPNGTAVPPRPEDAPDEDLAAELLCMRGVDAGALADAVPALRASFWFDGDLYMPVVNGDDVPLPPAVTMAEKGFSDPSLTVLAGVQRSEGTLFAAMGFPVVAFERLIVSHLTSAMGDRVARRLWRHYFPPTAEELLLEGPGGDESAHAGPAGLAESAQRAIDEAVDEAVAAVSDAVSDAVAAVSDAPGDAWRTHGHITTRTPHHRAPTVRVAAPIRWVSEAAGSRQWTSIANIVTDVWRCALVSLARRAAAVSAGEASGALDGLDDAALERAAAVADGAGTVEVTPEGSADAGDSASPGVYFRDHGASTPWLRSRVYLYHMLHAPSSLSWPGHRMGAFHGSEVGMLYNSSRVHAADRIIAEVMQPLVNRTLWSGTPDAEGDCGPDGRPAGGASRGSPVWCPVTVPRAEAANARRRSRGAAGARGADALFELHALHISRGDGGTGMRPFMHERRTGAWVCEDLFSEIVDRETLRIEMPKPSVEPLISRAANVLLVRSAVALVRRPTVRNTVLTGAALVVAVLLLGSWLSRSVRACATGCFCCCCCCCRCCGLCSPRPAELAEGGSDAGPGTA